MWLQIEVLSMIFFVVYIAIVKFQWDLNNREKAYVHLKAKKNVGNKTINIGESIYKIYMRKANKNQKQKQKKRNATIKKQKKIEEVKNKDKDKGDGKEQN